MVILRHPPLTSQCRSVFHDGTIGKPVTHTAICVVHPIIDRVHQGIFGVLWIARLGIVANLTLLVTNKVAITVAAVPKVWRFRDQHAALHERERPWHHKFVQKHSG